MKFTTVSIISQENKSVLAVQSHNHTNFFIPKKQASTTLLAIAASPIAKGSATAEPTADADAFFGRSFYRPQQQWGLTSYSNDWNMRYNPQMWGTQSGYFNKRSADAEPKADADAFFGRSFYQPQQQWGPSSYSNNWSRPQGYNFFGYY